jgi:Conserved TM helix
MVFASSHTWGDKLRDGFQGLFDFLPNVIGFLAVLVIGYFVAKIIAGALSKVLERAGLDRTLTEGQGGQYVSKVTGSPSRLLGRIAFWALMLGVLSLAASVLGISALTAFVGTVFAYLPNVVAALAIFLVAGALAAAIGTLVSRTMGDTPTGKIVATVVPGLVMAIAVFMILEQLQIAPEIVRITYAALLGALALAAALAFGLGGRDVAARMLEGAYQRGQESREQVRRDLQQGKERARQDLERTREPAEERTELPVRDAAATGSTAVR